MNDELWRQLQRESHEIQASARWMSIKPERDASGKIRVEVTLLGSFEADPTDLAGSIVREIHRRLTEFESRLE